MISVDLNARQQEGNPKHKIESKPIVENKTEVESGGKSKRKLWIMIGSLVLVLAAASLSLVAFPNFRSALKLPGILKGKAEPKREVVKATLALEPFLVNLADTDEIRFVKTTFQLGLAEDPGEEVKEPAVAAMRDSIISLLSSKTAEQILTPEGKDKLREEIRSRVNAITPKAKVLEVYIVDFVVQL